MKSRCFSGSRAVTYRRYTLCAIRRKDWCDQVFLTEPALPQLQNDPLIRLLMASDGVDPREVREVFAEIAGLRARCARHTKGTNSPQAGRHFSSIRKCRVHTGRGRWARKTRFNSSS